MGTKVYTYKEVSEHSERSDLWMVIKGKVYDITKYLNENPGDEKEFLKAVSERGTIAFENIKLSKDALKLLSKYAIGKIDRTSKPKISEEQRQMAQRAIDDINPVFSISVIVLIIAYMSYLFYLSYFGPVMEYFGFTVIYS